MSIISTVFTHNRLQAVRLPTEARLPDDVKKVTVRVRGHERIITPINQAWDHFFLNSNVVSTDFLNTRGDQKQNERESS